MSTPPNLDDHEHDRESPQATTLFCMNCPNNFFPGVDLIWSCCGETYCAACWAELTAVDRRCSLGNHTMKKGTQGIWTRGPTGESAVRQDIRAALLEETPLFASFKEETENFKVQEQSHRSDLEALRTVQRNLEPVISEEQAVFDTLNRGTASIRAQSYHVRRHADLIAERNAAKAAQLRDLNQLANALEDELQNLLASAPVQEN